MDTHSEWNQLHLQTPMLLVTVCENLYLDSYHCRQGLQSVSELHHCLYLTDY
jgi:hypothetical protein